MSSYSLFPVLTEDILNRIRFQGGDYVFSYSANGMDYSLEAKTMDANGSVQAYSLVDPNGRWSPDTDNWGFIRRVQIMSPAFLFGPKGIAPSQATLGVGIVWISTDSKQRGIFRIGNFNTTMANIGFDINCKFNQMQLRGRVELSVVLFIAEAAVKVPDDEQHLANMPGSILGELEKIAVTLDGEGSIFPIVMVNDPFKPLWYLTCEWEDPFSDPFSESIRLNLNREHRHFRYLDQSSTEFDDRLMREIMASALTIIITNLKENNDYWNRIESGEDLIHGSVAEAVNYFIKTHNWITSKPEATSVSIRQYFDKEMR